MKHDLLFFEDGTVSTKDGEYKNRLHDQLETIQAELEQLALEFTTDKKIQTRNVDQEHLSIKQETCAKALNHRKDNDGDESHSNHKKKCPMYNSDDVLISSKVNIIQFSSPSKSSRSCNTPNECLHDTGIFSPSHYDGKSNDS